jgi:hypothetical protein
LIGPPQPQLARSDLLPREFADVASSGPSRRVSPSARADLPHASDFRPRGMTPHQALPSASCWRSGPPTGSLRPPRPLSSRPCSDDLSSGPRRPLSPFSSTGGIPFPGSFSSPAPHFHPVFSHRAGASLRAPFRRRARLLHHPQPCQIMVNEALSALRDNPTARSTFSPSRNSLRHQFPTQPPGLTLGPRRGAACKRLPPDEPRGMTPHHAPPSAPCRRSDHPRFLRPRGFPSSSPCRMTSPGAPDPAGAFARFFLTRRRFAPGSWPPARLLHHPQSCQIIVKKTLIRSRPRRLRVSSWHVRTIGRAAEPQRPSGQSTGQREARRESATLSRQSCSFERFFQRPQ